jgi:RNA polymerase sigma-70 factor (sigma-E family)
LSTLPLPVLPRTSVSARTAGASAEFADVYAAHHGEALRLAYLLCGDLARAEDAVADAFVKVWRRWEAGGVTSPRAYVRRAVVNELNSRFRRLRLERREAQRRHGDDRGARRHDDALADTDQLLTALRQLPDRQRTAIVLRYYGDLTESETAATMGCSIGTVKSSVSRGLARLRDIVPQERRP